MNMNANPVQRLVLIAVAMLAFTGCDKPDVPATSAEPAAQAAKAGSKELPPCCRETVAASDA